MESTIMLNKINKFLNQCIEFFRIPPDKQGYRPAYRVINIYEDDNGDYMVRIQVINKNKTFPAKPEDILAHDNWVNCFSPCDVRTLSYLGYLGINSPKYKILAKRLSQENDKIVFALKKKGERKILVKTADEIIKEKDILKDFDSEDSHEIGYAVATETITNEKKAKEKILREMNHEDVNSNK